MSEQDQPLRLLFVCTANICRSAYAEVRAQQLLGGASGIEVSSAGTHGWIDQPMDAPMAAELRERGADPTSFRSRRLTQDVVRAADVILTMEKRHRDFILDEWPAAFKRTFTLQQFADLAGTTGTGDLRTLIVDAPRLRRAADAAGDVPDPYGRGSQVAASVAQHLDGALHRILRGGADPRG